MRAAAWGAAWVGCIAGLAGCAGAPAESFHTLSVVAQAEQASPSTASAGTPGIAVSIDRVTLPELVDRPQFVLRVDPNQVRILEQQRWAEPLRAAIPRVVGENLERILATAKVTAYPRDPPADVRYRIAIDITLFEAQAGEGVTVEAAWTLRNGDGSTARSGRMRAHELTRGPGYDTLAAAYSRALGTLSRDIAQAIAALAGAAR